MSLPGEQHWVRVEALSHALSALPPDQMEAQIAHLAASGESPTVLTLLGVWLGLPPLRPIFESGTVIGGRHTLREIMGNGGMGTVWRARQDLVGRDVAVKMIHPGLVTPALQARFLAEIEALGRLNHPGIARIFDAGFHERPPGPPVPFFAMELVEGTPLDQWAAERRRDHQALLKAVLAICAAVHSAHERRIVHRDLKPSNVLVRPDGQPVVLDFGIARLAGVITGEERGLFSGTFAYAAPEQHLGCDGDFRSGESVDVYAVGAMLFEVFAGRRIFNFPRGATPGEMRRVVLEAQVPRLSDVLPDCPPQLDEVVSRALRRDPADRFYSMLALGRAIGRSLEAKGPPANAPAWSPAAGNAIPGTQWRLVEKIGEGGTGEVWSGRHEQLGENRVFKFCDTEEKARTLKRELTLYRLLKGQVGLNPHFSPLHEVALEEPPWYLMMDQVNALDLAVWVQQQEGGLAGLPEDVRLEIIAQVAEALQAAHEAGILHRDIKPANVLVQGSGSASGIHVFVTDFGIGQIIVEGLLRQGTRAGFTRTVSDLNGRPLSGTLLYLAPEVLEGQAATIRSDIYSLGVVLWQLLAGNLHAALDPADWPSRIADPLLREDLARCLAGTPEKRWSSAGELANQLRKLPARRSAAARRQKELAARERAAYRRGVLKAAAIGALLVVLFATLAALAWIQRRAARRAHGELALRQVMTLPQTDFAAGRRLQGMSLLAAAADTVTNAAELRTAAAAVLGMADLIPVAPEQEVAAGTPSAVPVQPHELMRIGSHDGTLIAVARDLDGLNGAIDLFQTNGVRLRTFARKQFPWVPLAEPELLRFSPDDRWLAIGGPATSHHVLICQVADGSLSTYLFHGADPLCCAWHKGGRLLAVGCADDTIRLWDTAAGVNPASRAGPGNQFDLPPALDAPAEDLPLGVVRGFRGPVTRVAFSPDGRWLAALDDTGWLRIYRCFFPEGAQEQPGLERSEEPVGGPFPTAPVLAAEVRLDQVEHITRLDFAEDRVLVGRAGGAAEAFKLIPGELPAEMPAVTGITDLAWNGAGTRLGATTLTDIHWFRVDRLAWHQTLAGENPVGIASDGPEGGWLVATDRQLTEWQPAEDGTTNVFKMAAQELSEAVPGQGTRTALTTAGDGRTAAYCGKRIQFYDHHELAPRNTSVIADGGKGVFQELFWDRPGHLLGVTFALPDGHLRLETWQTTADFPPRCQACPPLVLDCQRVVPANDGRHFIARGGQRGLWLLDPVTGAEASLDTSGQASQSAAFAAAPDGSLVAMIVDHANIRLLALPSGALFADLESPRQTALTGLAWGASGRHLASATEDGFVQDWNLAPWQEWLARYGLQK